VTNEGRSERVQSACTGTTVGIGVEETDGVGDAGGKEAVGEGVVWGDEVAVDNSVGVSDGTGGLQETRSDRQAVRMIKQAGLNRLTLDIGLSSYDAVKKSATRVATSCSRPAKK
jgi:hypothetical protein